MPEVEIPSPAPVVEQPKPAPVVEQPKPAPVVEAPKPAPVEVKTEAPAQPAAVEADVKAGSHLKSSVELTGFPVFPAGTKSLLCKYLSREIWAEYKNTKDKMNFDFKDGIFSGV